jgi:hypothetical protein
MGARWTRVLRAAPWAPVVSSFVETGPPRGARRESSSPYSGPHAWLAEGNKTGRLSWHPPGWTEISALFTDVAFGDKDWVGGLSWRSPQETTFLCGETPFLGVTANNIGAIRLRESSGFVVRRELTIIARASMWDRPSRWSASGSQTRSPAPRRS